MRFNNRARWAPAATGVAFFLAALLSGPAVAQISRGPFLQNVQEHSILVVFEGPGPFLQATVNYGTQSVEESSAACQCVGQHCRCALVNLAPDTYYLYDVEVAAQVVGEGGHFVTAPDYNKAFQFAVHGDNRSDHLSHEMVVGNMMGEEYAVVMNTGDMVSSGEIEEDWDHFFQIETPFISRTPIYSAVGNHEEHDGKVEIYDRLFHPPSEESGSGSKTYYSFDYANAHFVVIDGFVAVHPWWECMLMMKLYDNCLSAEQDNWLQIDLKKAADNPGIDHVFVFSHEGPYSSKEGRMGSAALRDLLPVFAKSKVKVVFSGHDHYFEHGRSGNGIDYVISGGGGAPLYETKPDFLNQLFPHEIYVSKSIHNYQIVSVEGPLVQVVTYNVDDQTVIDEFQVGEKPACTAPGDCAGEEEGSCPGQWDCLEYTCVWICDGPASCQTAADCGDTPEGACGGQWNCDLGGKCQWLCDPEEECVYNAECADKDNLTDCDGGYWQCMDGMCEWFCPTEGAECIYGVDCADKTPPSQCDGGYWKCNDAKCKWICPDEPAEPDVESPQGDVVETPAGDDVTGSEDHLAQGDSGTDSTPPQHDIPSDDKSGCSASPSQSAPVPLAILFIMVFTLLLALRRSRQF